MARLRRRALGPATALAVAAILLWPARPLAHDIPADILIQAFVKPEPGHLRVLLRVPLAAARDVEFPLDGPGYLDLARADRTLHDAAVIWVASNLSIYEGQARLGVPRIDAVRASLPSDTSFATYDAARAHVTGPPLGSDTTLYWNQALLDVLLDYPIASEHSAFSIDPALARLGLRVVTVLRFLPPDGSVRAFEYIGDPGLVHLDPRWYQAAWQFVKLGFAHILTGADHLLFLVCLVLPLRRFRQLAIVITSFTVAHSVTLLASALNFGPSGLWFPPLIETLIAVSILYMALENIVGTLNVQRRWALTFAFGLVHGFGFSFALRETLQFAGSYLLTSLLSFNLGVELGQLAVLLVLVPAIQVLFRRVVAERMGIIVISAFVAHTAWHWMLDRFDRLRQFSWPTPDAADLAALARWLIAIVALAGIWWLVRSLRRPKPVPGLQMPNDGH